MGDDTPSRAGVSSCVRPLSRRDSMPDLKHAHPGWGRALAAAAAVFLFVPAVVGAIWPTSSMNASAASTSPGLGGCPMLPGDNVWNARVDSLPIHARSSAYVGS